MGNIVVADSFHNTAQLMDSVSGSFMAQLGEMSLISGAGLLQPLDTVLDLSTKRALVTSHNTQAVEVFDLTGILPDQTGVADWILTD